ncbi:hypothetical protein D3C78_1416660 [compost metagenome]
MPSWVPRTLCEALVQPFTATAHKPNRSLLEKLLTSRFMSSAWTKPCPWATGASMRRMVVWVVRSETPEELLSVRQARSWYRFTVGFCFWYSSSTSLRMLRFNQSSLSLARLAKVMARLLRGSACGGSIILAAPMLRA